MTIYESVKEGLDFIEDNLEKSIGVLDVANAVSYSQFYFSRKFSELTHMSIYDYIVRRKLTESYKYLFNTKSRIIDVAYKYGFKSHEVYTRSFKKAFGFNPSEIKEDKSLALFERIGDEYLTFLDYLRIEKINEDVSDCYFEGEPTEEIVNDKDLLIVLSKDNYSIKEYLLKGKMELNRDKVLSYELMNLKHKIRIYSNNTKLAFRFFIDNYYNIDEMGSNYILISKGKDLIDIIIPC